MTCRLELKVRVLVQPDSVRKAIYQENGQGKPLPVYMRKSIEAQGFCMWLRFGSNHLTHLGIR